MSILKNITENFVQLWTSWRIIQRLSPINKESLPKTFVGYLIKVTIIGTYYPHLILKTKKLESKKRDINLILGLLLIRREKHLRQIHIEFATFQPLLFDSRNEALYIHMISQLLTLFATFGRDGYNYVYFYCNTQKNNRKLNIKREILNLFEVSLDFDKNAGDQIKYLILTSKNEYDTVFFKDIKVI